MKRLFVLTVIAAIITCAVSVYSSELYNVSYDRNNAVVTISGKISESGKKITVEVLNAGVESEDLKGISAEQLPYYVYTTKQTVSDADGKFSIEFKMVNSTDRYVIRTNTGSVEETVLEYANPDEYKKEFEKINSDAATTDSIYEQLENSGAVLGTVNEYYAYLDKIQKKIVASEMLNARNNMEGRVFKDNDALVKTYDSFVIIGCINMLKEKNIDTVTMLKKYGYAFDIKSCSAYELYAGFDDTKKSDTLQRMGNNEKITSVNGFVSSFIEQTVITAIEVVNGYSEVYKILTDNNEMLGLDFRAYNGLDELKQALVMQAIAGKSFSSAENIKKVFNQEVTNVNKKTEGGGGGSKNNGTTGTTVKVQNPQNLQNNTQSNITTDSFSDLSSCEWARDSIIKMYNKKILSGKGDGKFYPNDFVKREEFVKILVCAMDFQISKGSNVFEDAKENMWYTQYINTASSLKLVNGVNENIFGIGENISRQDIAVMLFRTAMYLQIELPGGNSISFYDTNNISSYALEAVNALARAGIINGNENGGFEPVKNATRAEAAKLIDKFSELAKQLEDIR